MHTVAARLVRVRSTADLVEHLRAAGRTLAPTASFLPQRPPFLADHPATLLNPGDGAPLYAFDTAPPAASLHKALRAAARSAPTGCAAAFVCTSARLGLHVALADSARVAHSSTPAARLDPRAQAAHLAFASTDHAAVAVLCAFRTLEKRAVTRAFFKEVQSATTTLTAAWLDGPTSVHDRHALTITFLCRMMFLYFIQQKRWLDNDRGFLASLALDPRADRIYQTRLQPLFFDTLNTPASARPASAALPNIPYLNGGLFTPTPLETAHPNLDLPDANVRDLLASTLERYDFITTERDDAPGVDPEMLGAVFESLMDPDHRGSSGTFYTPAPLVDQCVHDALHAYFTQRSCSAAADRLLDLTTPCPAPPAQLRDLTVLDPAMGSGAFLLGALRALTKLRVHHFGETPAAATRDIIANGLHGVDLSPTAVSIAQLRLWLALTALLPDTPANLQPLPNLSHNLHCGDALVPPTHLIALNSTPPDSALLATIATLTSDFSTAHGPRKSQLATALNHARRTLAIDLLTNSINQHTAQIQSLEALTAPDLFGHQPPLNPSQSATLQHHKSSITTLQTQLRQIRSGRSSLAFDFRTHFAVPFARGFDLIVGNPPWVRLSKLPPTTRNHVRARYAWTHPPSPQPFGTQPDLSVAFTERAVSLLAPNGALSFVLPSKLFTTNYGAGLRHALSTSTQLHTIRDFSATPSFAADVFPATITLTNAAPSPTHPIAITTCSGRTNRTTHRFLSTTRTIGSEWPLLCSDAAKLLHQLLQTYPPLSASLNPRSGLKTGANRVFLSAPDSTLTIPTVRGRDVSPFRCAPTSTLLFAHDPVTGEPLEAQSLPPEIKAHLAVPSTLSTLRNRADARPSTEPHHIFRVSPENLHHRVVWRDIATRLDAAYLPPVAEGGPAALNTTYVIPVPSPAVGLRLVAWLTSTPLRFCAAARAERALAGYRRFMLHNVAQLPVPPILLSPDPLPIDPIAATLNRVPDSPEALQALDFFVCQSLRLLPHHLALISNEAHRFSLPLSAPLSVPLSRLPNHQSPALNS